MGVLVLQLSTTVHRRKEELPCLENRTRPWLAVLLKSSLIKDTSTEHAFFSTDSVEHIPSPPGFLTGLAGFKQSFTLFRQAFPDLHCTVEDTIAEGD
jgi:predicted ester cyclase